MELQDFTAKERWFPFYSLLPRKCSYLPASLWPIPGLPSSNCSRGGFRISSRGWQRYLQGVAKQIARGILPLSVFCFLTQHYLFTPNFVWHFRHIVTRIYLKYTLCFLLFPVRLLSFIQSLVPRNLLGSGGRHPLKRSGGGEWGRATPRKPPLHDSIPSFFLSLYVPIAASFRPFLAFLYYLFPSPPTPLCLFLSSYSFMPSSSPLPSLPPCLPQTINHRERINKTTRLS